MLRSWLSTPVLLAAAFGITLLGPEASSGQFRGGFSRGFVGGFGGVPFYPYAYYPYGYGSMPYSGGYNPYGYGSMPYSGGYNPWSFTTANNTWAFAPAYNSSYFGGYSNPGYNLFTPSNAGYGFGPVISGTATSSQRPVGRGTIREYYTKTMTPVLASRLTEEKGAGAKKKVARIEVKVPADARVWFDGAEIDSTGTERSFVTPSLAKKHTYAVRARWTVNGSTTTEIRRVTVQAGDHPTVDFTKPVEVRTGNISNFPISK
jgi:uncharacterized protein (TIGR03000 family)